MSGRKKKKVSKEQLLAAHQKHWPNVAAMGEELKCSRATIYRLLKSYEIAEHPEPEAPVEEEFSRYIPEEDPSRISRASDKAIEALHDSGEHALLLVGEPGTGKTTIVEQIAAVLRLPFLRVPCDSSLEFAELFGWTVLTHGATRFQPGLLLRMIQAPSVILFDEVNNLDPGKVSLLYQLLDSHSVFVREANTLYRLHANAYLLLAANPPGPGQHGGRVNSALLSRVMTFEVPPFTQDEVRRYLKERHSDLESSMMEKLVRFYVEIRQLCEKQDLPVRFGIREVRKFILALKATHNAIQALHASFLDGIVMLDSVETKRACEQIVLATFGRLPA